MVKERRETSSIGISFQVKQTTTMERRVKENLDD